MNSIETVQRGVVETPAASQTPSQRARPAPAAPGGSITPASESPEVRGTASDAELARDVQKIARELSDLTPHVTFKVEEEDGTVVVRVLNPETKEVVRQIPPKELLEIRRRMDEYLGMLADEVA